MVMEPKYLAFPRWLYTPSSSSDKVIGCLGNKTQNTTSFSVETPIPIPSKFFRFFPFTEEATVKMAHVEGGITFENKKHT